jgi:hypothetical protein
MNNAEMRVRKKKEIMLGQHKEEFYLMFALTIRTSNWLSCCGYQPIFFNSRIDFQIFSLSTAFP